MLCGLFFCVFSSALQNNDLTPIQKCGCVSWSKSSEIYMITPEEESPSALSAELQKAMTCSFNHRGTPQKEVCDWRLSIPKYSYTPAAHPGFQGFQKDLFDNMPSWSLGYDDWNDAIN